MYAWDSTLGQNLAPLGDAPDREHDGSAATRRGRVDRLDVDARLRQPRGDARERSRLVAHAHDERRLLRGAVLGVAQRTLSLTEVFDHDVDLSASGPRLGTKCRNVDMSVGQRARERREDAGAGPEAEGKLGDFGHRYTSSSTVGRRSRPQCLSHGAGSSSYDLIRPQQQRLRDRRAKRLGGFEVDDELECRYLLDGYLGSLRPPQNLVDRLRHQPVDFL